MSSTQDFVNYVCEQLSSAGEISSKKMFGEYGIYCNNKIIGLICDNQFYLKKTNFAQQLLGPNAQEAAPYANAKPQYLIDSLDDTAFLCKLIQGTYNELPAPKPKKTTKK